MKWWPFSPVIILFESRNNADDIKKSFNFYFSQKDRAIQWLNEYEFICEEKQFSTRSPFYVISKGTIILGDSKPSVRLSSKVEDPISHGMLIIWWIACLIILFFSLRYSIQNRTWGIQNLLPLLFILAPYIANNDMNSLLAFHEKMFSLVNNIP